MYEKFKNDMMVELTKNNYGMSTIDDVMKILDKVSNHYEINSKRVDEISYRYYIPELVQMYLVSKRIEGLSEDTLYNYKIILNLFFQYAEVEPNMVNANHIRMFLHNHKKERKVSNRTLDKYRDYICEFFIGATRRSIS